MSDKHMMSGLWDQILDEAAMRAADHLGEIAPSSPPVQFSKEHEEKMRRLFRRVRRKKRMKAVRRYSIRAAVVILTLGVVATATIFSVDAFRIRFLNFVMDVNPTYTELQLKEEQTHGSYANNTIELSYVPTGFVVEQERIVSNYLNISFRNNGVSFSFSRSSIQVASTIDTENAELKNFTINGMEAILSAKEEVSILAWHDDRYAYEVLVDGNMPEDEIIQIAEGVKNLN